MRLLLVGPPGSGKGTQAQLLSDRKNVRHIGTGELLREAIAGETPAGKLAKSYVKKGELVPDDVVNQMVAELFRANNRPSRFVMDGYPRSVGQAIAFDVLLDELSLPLEAVVELQVEDEALVRRLAGRLICPVCNTIYHVISSPPKRLGLCDLDNSPLKQREDDNEKTIRYRLKLYHDNTADLFQHYRIQGKFQGISADQDIEKVYSDLLKVLKVK